MVTPDFWRFVNFYLKWQVFCWYLVSHKCYSDLSHILLLCPGRGKEETPQQIWFFCKKLTRHLKKEFFASKCAKQQHKKFETEKKKKHFGLDGNWKLTLSRTCQNQMVKWVPIFFGAFSTRYIRVRWYLFWLWVIFSSVLTILLTGYH